MKKNVALGIVIAAIILAIYFISTSTGETQPNAGPGSTVNGTMMPKAPADDMKKDAAATTVHAGEGFAPELAGIAGYINTDPILLSELRGKVVLVDFWTYSCINCIRTLPYVKSWWEKYKDDGFVVIGVHTPEFDFEKKYENVAAAAKKYNLTYPIVLDNDYATWNSFKNNYWPRHYLIDKDGVIRYDHIGEGGYAETEKEIQELLGETGMKVNDSIEADEKSSLAERFLMSPETYAGSDRNPGLGSKTAGCVEDACTYTDPGRHDRDVIYLEGTWKQDPAYLQSIGSGYLIFDYYASSINAVLSTDAGKYQADIFLDGKYLDASNKGRDVIIDSSGRSYINVTMPDLYALTNHEFGKHELKIVPIGQGFRLNSFTFG